jgi:hypothetical protein
MKLVERLLITVKTYPTISSSNIETVCTGGVTDAGEWRRLYPIPFRYLEGPKQYRLFDVVYVEVSGSTTDSRPETRRPVLASLRVVERLESWTSRCQWVNPTILPSMRAMIEKGKTLVPVRVREVLSFDAVPAEDDWTTMQKEKLNQELLFEKRKPLEKIPFDFRVRWRDDDGAEHDSLFISWEVCQTFRAYRRRYRDPVKEMTDKWMRDIFGCDKELSFFIGNMARFRANYLLCGTFSPPKEAANNELLF